MKCIFGLGKHDQSAGEEDRPNLPNPCVIALIGRLLTEIGTFEPLSRYEVTEEQLKVVAERVFA